MEVGTAEKILTASAWKIYLKLANDGSNYSSSLFDIPQAHHYPGLLTTAPTTHVGIDEPGACD